LVEAHELVSPGSGGLAYRDVSTESLSRAVLTAVSSGQLMVVPGWPGHAPPAQRTKTRLAIPEPAVVAAPVLGVKAERTTWFEVEVIDEVGEPIADVALLFDVGGELRQLATDGSGVARMDGIRETSGSVRLGNPKELRAKLNARWTGGRDKEWIAPLVNVVEVWEGAEPRPFDLHAKERLRLMLHPPQRVRLLEHGGTALAGTACSVSVGGIDYQLTADGAGWVEFPVGVDSCPETARVEWSETHEGITRAWSVEVVLECHVGDPSAIARARLRGLGYEADDVDRAVAEFRRDHGLPDDDAAAGEVSPATRHKIAEAWEAAHG
jgi:hypothetical protein